MVNPFTPPLYKNFGKSNKDILTKKYEYDHSIKFINKPPASGLTLETHLINTATNAWRGHLKAVQKQVQKQGDLEINLSTDPTLASTAAFTFNPYQGAVAKIETTTKDKDPKFTAPTFISNVEYTGNHIATSLNLKSDTNRHTVEVTGVTGAEGLSAGGILSVDLSNPSSPNVTDMNVAAEYTPNKNYTYTVFSTKYFDYANFLVYGRLPFSKLVARRTDVAAQASIKLDDPSKPTVFIGVEHAVNSTTVLKKRLEFPSLKYDLAIEYRLNNPRLILGFAGKYNLQKLIKTGDFSGAEKFGVSATWGDY